MSPTEEQVKYRATELQDILSSFDPEILPAQYEESTFQNVTRHQPSPVRRRRTSDWTITGNLAGTLLQWGAYNEEAWQFLGQIQSQAFRARAFSEKINRRFDVCFDDYDVLQTSTNATAIRDDVNLIAGKLHFLSNAIYEDRQHRQLGETDTLVVAFRALESLCERSRPFSIVPKVAIETTRRPTRRTISQTEARSESVHSLFAVVLGQNSGSSDTPNFLLEALECISSASLRTFLPQLVFINGLLHRHKADEGYIQRFEALQQKANEETADAFKVPEGPGGSGSGSGSGRGGNGGRRSGGRSHGLEADPKPGSKRPPQSTSDTTQKRGRTSGTK